MMSGSTGDSQIASVKVTNLSYQFPNGKEGLKSVSLSLPRGSRALLIGANGAGKTTLLQLLSGKRLAPGGAIALSGVDPFKHGSEDVTYLGPEWVLNPITRSDMDVPTLLRSVGGDYYKERRDELIQILDVDVSWRLHAISDGERRRVQLVMGLLRPWTVLLLDEITVDMDLLSRANFLDFLRRETEQRPCTVVYATHILDNLATWPTHLIHMHLGLIKEAGETEPMIGRRSTKASNNGLLSDLVLEWLKEDFAARGPRAGLADGS